jgi:hypothetical protein
MRPASCSTPGYALDSTLGQGWSFSSPHAQREWQRGVAGDSLISAQQCQWVQWCQGLSWAVDDSVPLDHVCATGHHHWVQLLPQGNIILQFLYQQRLWGTLPAVMHCCLCGTFSHPQGSWWGAIRPIMGAAALLYAVPAGATLRAYSNLAFTRCVSTGWAGIRVWAQAVSGDRRYLAAGLTCLSLSR